MFNQYLALASTTLDRRLSSTFRRRWMGYSTYASSVSNDQQTPPRHASVNLVYDTKPRRYDQDDGTEFIRSGKSEDEATTRPN